MSVQSAKTLIIGATAGTGLITAKKLIQQNEPVRIIARNRLKAVQLFGTSNTEIVICDITKPNDALRDAFKGIQRVIYTAAVPPRRASEEEIRQVDFEGFNNVLAAAKSAGFKGRFVYLTTMGLNHSSFLMKILGMIKPGIVQWRLAAIEALRDSGLTYSIVRAGLFKNATAGKRQVASLEEDRPLTMGTAISRNDTAGVLIQESTKTDSRNSDVVVYWQKKAS
ncbi:MAG: NAD-dependent epimerase/dehydratase family protein [Candidatus Kapabacteria bacterium]|nr:NAD-dependent epimerase/dehydratase family protein [Candidatus Kapabacteria bacterium]